MMDEKISAFEKIFLSTILTGHGAAKIEFDGNDFNVEAIDIYPTPAKRCLCCGGRNVDHDA